MAFLQWDIFCKVIDNFGDIGVCWRLAADLANRGQRVRLWVDDSSALAWMAPGRHPGIEVLDWASPLDVACLQTAPCDVLVETFGCNAAPEFIAACAHNARASGPNDAKEMLWINLEYLSAEPYVARSHGLKSLISHGPAHGKHKVFYYPGFTPGTGGLLREPGLLQRQATFNRAAWLQQIGIDWAGEALISMFCYEPPALHELLQGLAEHGLDGKPARLLVTAGRATQAVKALQNTDKYGLQPLYLARKQLSISYLPYLSQTDFDHLLWACDVNFVRGEDSVVRAIWAAKPFVWQIYPQADGAHGVKLQAFLDMLNASAHVQAVHHAFNGLAAEPLPLLTGITAWSQVAFERCLQLARQTDLTTGLLDFALKNR